MGLNDRGWDAKMELTVKKGGVCNASVFSYAVGGDSSAAIL